MIFLGKDLSSTIKEAFRYIKYSIWKDSPEEMQAAQPWGYDARPVKDAIALVVETAETGEAKVIGYVFKGALQALAVGEVQVYSTDANGAKKAFMHLKNTGVMQLSGDTIELNGNANHATQYEALNTELQSFKTAIQTELAAIALGVAAGGGSYTPGTLTLNLNSAKLTTVKTA